MESKGRFCTAQLFHLIRASAVRIRKAARPTTSTYEADLGRILASLLVGALSVRSATDVAIILGSAAELQMYPDDELFDWSNEVLEREDLHLRGIYWTVRHRCSRGSTQARRFSVPEEALQGIETPVRWADQIAGNLATIAAKTKSSTDRAVR